MDLEGPESVWRISVRSHSDSELQELHLASRMPPVPGMWVDLASHGWGQVAEVHLPTKEEWDDKWRFLRGQDPLVIVRLPEDRLEFPP